MKMMKNKKGEYFVAIHSRLLQINTRHHLRTSIHTDAKSKALQIQNRINAACTDGSLAFHGWNKVQQLAWIKTGICPEAEAVVLADAIQQWLDGREFAGKAITTIEGYRRELAVALEFFGSDCALSSLSASELQKWVNWQRKKTIRRGRNVGSTCKVLTVKGRLARLRAVVQHFKGLGISGLNPDAFDIPDLGVDPDSIEDLLEWEGFEERLKRLERLGIDQGHEHAFSKVFFERTELSEMLAYYREALGNSGLEDFRVFCAILFCSFTGTRRSELTRIRRADVILDGDLPTATLTKLKGRKSKSLLRQTMVIPPMAIEALEKLLEMMPSHQQSLFCADDNHLKQNGFDERIVLHHADQLTKAYDRVRSKTKWIHAAGWHKFRHTLASILLQQGYSQLEVKETIGWCEDSMAERYSHLAVSKKSTIINSTFSSSDF